MPHLDQIRPGSLNWQDKENSIVHEWNYKKTSVSGACDVFRREFAAWSMYRKYSWVGFPWVVYCFIVVN